MGIYIITRAAGFVGSALAEKLISENHRIITIDNLSTDHRKNIPDEVEFYQDSCQEKVL